MDRNTVTGLLLIFGLFMLLQYMNSPSQEQIEEQRRIQDSIARADFMQDSLAKIQAQNLAAEANVVKESLDTASDSLKQSRLTSEFGPFALAAAGEEKDIVLENDVFRIIFSNKGGRIKEVELKEYYKIYEDEEKNEVKTALQLLEDSKNEFSYFLPIANLPSGGIYTDDLYFEPSSSGQSIRFKASAGEGRSFEQVYTLKKGSYVIDYKVKFNGLQNVLSGNADHINLKWVNFLDKLEKNDTYERNYSSIYYKPLGNEPDHCSCTSNDTEDAENQRINWVSHSNQFFNSSLIAKEEPFQSAKMETLMLDAEEENLKELKTNFLLPYGRANEESFSMDFYIGPNDFEALANTAEDLEYIIPFGWSIFGTINRWVIRPIFSFLSSYIGSAGIVILVLTFIVKLVLYPLTYKMLHSQSKMGALKPQLENMRGKFKDDQQKQQMETMKLYREFGVNPLGGCMPMVLQMPIWFALYRFFPASIEFRQASFLWATDLSSYDVFFRLPFEIPFGFGSHISLFTILWATTTLIYTFYNTKHMDFSANPAMKYMQYIMPIFFVGFFNSFASGLTCYLLFSNLFNITQTIVTKNYIIDQEKIKRELEEYRKKPKKEKTSKFQQRLQQAMEEQQKVQAQPEAQKKKKKRK